MSLRDAVSVHRGYLPVTVQILAGAAQSSRLWEADNVWAAIVPITPGQLMANRVIAISNATLVHRLADIASAYRECGVTAWSIWTTLDTETDSALLAAGYRRAPAEPAIMLDLREFEREVSSLDYDASAAMRTLGEINERAYPTGAGLSAALADNPPDLQLRVYAARYNDRLSSVVATLDHEHAGGLDCTVHWAATVPEARGNGLAPRLMTAALLDARRRGCTTASGTASKMGGPVWTKFGWHTVFDYQIYEWVTQ